MKDYFWTTLFLLAVLRSAVAFKIPGLSGGGSGRSPSSGAKAAATGGGGNAHKDGGEYMGPVFIIRELDKDKGEYDAFVTTGGIQEVKPPHPQQQYPYNPQQQHHHQPQQQPQHHQQQMVYQMNPSASTPMPDLAKDDAEDSEYFGVLITPDTVRTLNYPKSTNINVSLSVLLVAASSRMPWLLVLHRKNYPAFEYQQQQQQQPQQQQPLHGYQQQQQPQQQQQQSAAASGVIPGMQIPQRRRQYSPPLDRQRRGVNAPSASSQYRAAQWSDGSKRDNGDVKEYDISDDDTKVRELPLMFERQLMATMCYNFVQENAGVNRPPVNEFNFDGDAYATVIPKNRGYPVIKVKTTYTKRAGDEAGDAGVPPNRMFWTPEAIKEASINAELNRMFPKRVSSQTTEKIYTNEELDRMYPIRVAPQTGEFNYTDEDLNRMFPKRVPAQTTEKIYTNEELDRMYPIRVAPQTREFDYTDEDLNRMFPRRVEPQPAPRAASQEEVGDESLTQATGGPAKNDIGMEDTDRNRPEHVSPQPTDEVDAEGEQERTLVRVEPFDETVGPSGAAEEKQANRATRVESQPTTKPLTVEEAMAADKVFTRHDS